MPKIMLWKSRKEIKEDNVFGEGKHSWEYLFTVVSVP